MGSQLLSYHNLAYMMRVNFLINLQNIDIQYIQKCLIKFVYVLQLSKDLHNSIIEGRFPEYVVSL